MAINDKKDTEKVSMNFTVRDLDNIEFLTDRLNARQKVIAISRSLGITRALIELLDEGGDLLMEDQNGNIRRLEIIL